ncbi:MAG TPA: hypothetical protein VMV20_00295 [Chitinophagaceae bacterium]|nr:hypothetical protein [Chitinophagaceae bacterium]
MMLNRMLLLPVLLILSLGLRAQDPLSPTPAASRMAGLARRKAMVTQSLLSRIRFRNIGPSVMGGRAVDLAVNPRDPTEFFVAYATGGLWYTHNNGQSFIPLFDSEQVITIGAIAVDWNPPLPVIWVGTGEANSSRSSYAGNGIYRSDDGGKHWVWVGLPESQHIGRILLDPQHPGTAWVAAMGHLFSSNPERGVYLTRDGGSTWKKSLYVNPQTGAIDLALDPAHPDTVFAAMWQRSRAAWNFQAAGPGSGIYRTTDGGRRWVLLSGPGSGFPGGDTTGRIGLALFEKAPSLIYAIVDNNGHRKPGPKDSVIYHPRDFLNMDTVRFARLDNKKLEAYLRKQGFPSKYTAASVKSLVASGKIRPQALHDYVDDAEADLYDTPVIGAEIYLSRDGGDRWEKMNRKYLDLFASYGYYFGKIWVSPTDPGKLVIAGISLLLSRDSGRNFQDIDAPNIHGDHHALWFDPSRDTHFINANDGGLNITYDDGKHWFKCNTPAVGQFYSVTTDDAHPYNVYGGLQDNGVWSGPSTNVENPGWYQSGQYPFHAVNGGDGMQVQVDTRDNNTVYSGSQFGYYARNLRSDPEKTRDIHPQADLGQDPLRWNWETPIWLSRHNQDIFYMGSDQFIRSLDRGDSLEILSPDLTHDGYGHRGNVPYGTLTTLEESPLRFGRIYAGSDDGLVQVSEDDGETWTRISDGLPQKLWVSRVEPSKFQVDRLYVSLNGYHYDNFNPYLFRTNDNGKHWENLGAGLPEGPINVVREDPSNPDLLYVGTDNGLYVSVDQGKDFMAMMGGLPPVPIHDIAIQERDSEIVLATHGRSLYVASLRQVRRLPFLKDQPVALLDLKGPKSSSNWGKSFGGAVYRPSLEIPYFVSGPGVVQIRILLSDTLVRETKDTAVAGFNFYSYDLVADSNLVRGEAQRGFHRAEDSLFYLAPGAYQVEIVTSSGNKARGNFEIRPMSDKDQRNQADLLAPEQDEDQ